MTYLARKILIDNIPCKVDIRKWGEACFDQYELMSIAGKYFKTDKGQLHIKDIADYQDVISLDCDNDIPVNIDQQGG